jgi:hypothetical protein
VSDPHREDEVPASDAAHAKADTIRHDETVEDEEKILAGRIDVNMPALLTKDVQGG